MEASNGAWHIGGVKDEVTDLTEEDIGGLELKGYTDCVSGMKDMVQIPEWEDLLPLFR